MNTTALSLTARQCVRPATLQHVSVLVSRGQMRAFSALPTRSTAVHGRSAGLFLSSVSHRQFHMTLGNMNYGSEESSPSNRQERQEPEGFKIYIGNLPFFYEEANVRTLLEKVGGDVLSINVPTGTGARTGRRFAFAHFQNEADAHKAISELNGTVLGDNNTITVSLPRTREQQLSRQEDYRSQRGERRPPSDVPRTKRVATDRLSKTNLFVANLPFDLDENALAEIFRSQDLRVKWVKILRTKRENRVGRTTFVSRGFGFVELEDAAQQEEAIEKLHGVRVGEREMVVSAGKETEEVPVTPAQYPDGSY